MATIFDKSQQKKKLRFFSSNKLLELMCLLLYLPSKTRGKKDRCEQKEES
jgi:hypothetical protein